MRGRTVYLTAGLNEGTGGMCTIEMRSVQVNIVQADPAWAPRVWRACFGVYIVLCGGHGGKIVIRPTLSRDSSPFARKERERPVTTDTPLAIAICRSLNAPKRSYSRRNATLNLSLLSKEC